MRAVRDNREFIERLQASGDLIRVRAEVDWDLEMGAIVRRVCERGLPAVLFEQVKDYPEFRVLGAPLATYRRLAIAMGLSPDISVRELLDEYVERVRRPIKPVMVADAPWRRNVMMDEEVDLFALPAPMVHDGDGGRYLGTWHLIAVKDPDSDWVNWGMYRLMIHNHRTMAGLCLPFSDQGRIFYQKYVPKGQPMPFAVAIGPDPLCAMVSAAPFGVGVSEVDYAGALRGEPVELARCLTSDIPVPANAEVVIEGEILPQASIEEGPFGEYTGYRSSPRALRSVYRVKAIAWREEPIFTMSNMGVPVDDCDVITSVSWRAEIRRLLEAEGIPITGVYCPPETIVNTVIVGVRTVYSNIASQIAALIFSNKSTAPWFNQVIVVDADVDVYDLREVLHALTTKCHPVRGIRVFEHFPANPLTPFLSLQERTWGQGAKVLFDCTWPLHWSRETEVPPRASFEEMYPQEIKDRVLRRWEEYGFKS